MQVFSWLDFLLWYFRFKFLWFLSCCVSNRHLQAISMKIICATLLALVAKLATAQHFVTQLPSFTKLSADELHHLRERGFGPTHPSVYASTAYEHEETQTAASQQRISIAQPDEPYYYQNVIPVKQKVALREREQPIQQAQYRPGNKHQQPQPFRQAADQPPPLKSKKQQLEEEEIEEPDRLTLLLPQSKFECSSKNTGYYADEELGCEVFHYCQDNAKHSWICPEGFTFHQVHLICMPPGGDNICEKSSQYHFVNEYLYKPVNLDEHQRKPNISLRYSDRYYPDNYYQERQYDDEDDDQRPILHRNSVRVNQDAPIQRNLLVEQPIARTTFRPETTLAQVFRSPNEVNIPLQNRRPQYHQQRYLNREE